MKPKNVVCKSVWGKDVEGAPAPWIDVSWFGAVDGRTRSHVLRYRELSPRDSGNVFCGTTLTLSDVSKAWTVDTFGNGGYCYLTGTLGPTVDGEHWADDETCEGAVSRMGTDNLKRILSNTATQLTFAEAWTVVPAPGEEYEIYWATGEWHEVTIGKQQFVQLPGLPEGNEYMIEVAAVPTVSGT